MSEDQPSALLVGTDVYAMRACLRTGIKPYVVHGPHLNDWGSMELPEGAVGIFAEDPTSIESILFSLRRAGATEREFLFVQTSDEEALVTVAALAKVLDLPTPVEADIALHFRDKWLQKQIVSAAGVDVAASQVIEDIQHLDPAGLADFGRAVLKPLAGAGTRNTSVVGSREELVATCQEYRRRGVPQRTFVLEEFITGDEWMVDGVVFDGELQFLSVGSYVEPCLTAVDSNRVLQLERFDPTADAGVYDLARPVVAAALRALGLRRGVFHMELFHQQDTGRLVFGECAARTGGGLIHESVEYKFGVDLGAAAIRCAAGVDPQVEPKVRPDSVSTIFLAGRPGTLIGRPSPAEIRALPGVEHVRLDLPYGFRMADSVADTTEGVGQVMLSGRTREEVRERREFLTQWFDERLTVVPTHADYPELRRWQQANWPDSVSPFGTYPRD
ncbi:acetyl-CoA carboxylase biotin carboxylase subunit family protein [Kitasatospora sp. Root107]|uniref:ATP-grasp domain-containing protein n=1 Tax=Kitasatospora sp. Root107 TaxID=1736424 RepID=UPI00070FF030|nr:ATP-grasp domain-containing protein [Kitasatospora sp. Root107]KQV13812.1 hypothetical protein ASC99_32845 [Kitasatospora sp. Root107]